MVNDPILKITEIRAKNNILWMEILRLAVHRHPVESKRIIKAISKNDKEITKWLKRL